ncbi:hypothetical protein GCM10023340_38810 [Nocardioides marinquilinus]|uniref:Terminase n=1 Tax=Nocardioides marinquilinus TaxID=1210400 RepID=A0ABP9Q6E1_9ACTN
MKPSSPLPARRLIEPDVWTCPHGKRVRPEAFETFGPEVADVCAKTGYVPDPQQELILDLAFAFRPDGSPASFEICVICCRQNLKTGVLKMIVLGWLYVLDVPEIVWSAHEMSTTLDAQSELADLIQGSPALSRRVLPQRNRGVYTDNGSERLELRDPRTGLEQTVMFKARTKSGGRGLARPKLILDESFALTPRMLGSLIPIMLAMTNPQVVYASSPGMADSDALGEIRERGTAGSTPMMTYVEWHSPRTPCEDPDCQHPKNGDPACALNRVELWEKANPTLSTGRITLEKIANTRQALPAEEFMRECLGWWESDEEDAGATAVDLRAWRRLVDERVPASTRVAVVLDVEPDKSAGSIGVAGDGPAGRTLLVVQTKPGLAWMVPAVERLRERLGDGVLEVALHPTRTAGLSTRLTAAGIDHVTLPSKDYTAGCSALLDGLDEGTLVHTDQAEMTAAAAFARTRYVNEVPTWDRRDTDIHVGPIVAPATALHRFGALTAVAVVPAGVPRSEDEAAVRREAIDIATVRW